MGGILAVMARISFYLCFWIVLGTIHTASAKRYLSPGHRHLSDDASCSRCHTPFKGTPNTKCLDCHKKIAKRLDENKGYHARALRQKNCNECHREHVGPNHDITPLNKRTFDHRKTGWTLTGAHTNVACRQCHSAKRPKTKRDSYLDTPNTCQGCHGSYHGQARKGDLDDCEKCHNTRDWTRLNGKIRFDHSRETVFPLTGQHTELSCEKCHLGKRKFGPIEVTGCVTCHSDPHPKGTFGARICEECHLTSGFKGKSAFDHGSTGWPLRGKHRKNECADCHKWKKWAPKGTECGDCHQNNHGDQFRGQSCSSCHRETGFTGRHLRFDHNKMSRFQLEGRHKRVDCAKCHPGGHYKPIEPTCVTCHSEKNPHGDTFGDAPCSQCHSPRGWNKTRFDHSVTGFELIGRHEQQPCFRCHPSGTETEDDTDANCTFCHPSVHKGQFKTDPCDKCHAGFESWEIPFFDHQVSRFSLEGQHQQVACAGCHTKGHYKPIDVACGNCHKNFHEGQFSKPCNECHSPSHWSPLAKFDHTAQTRYPLEGSHAQVDCAKCHIVNRYRGTPTECADCHLDVHDGRRGGACDRCHTISDWSVNLGQDHDFGPFSLGGSHDLLPCERCHGPDRKQELAGRGPECVNCHRDPHFGSLGPQCFECHTQVSFLPSTFLHTETGFRLSGAHRFVECRDCHPGRVFGGLPNSCDFCHQDTFAATAGSPRCDHPRCVGGGLATCHNCHRTQSWVPARPGVSCGICDEGANQ